MSLRRKDFLSRTLYARDNLKHELVDNVEKLQRRLDNLYFEDDEMSPSNLPVVEEKQQSVLAMKLLNRINTKKIQVSHMNLLVQSISPKTDDLKTNPYEVIEMLEADKDINVEEVWN